MNLSIERRANWKALRDFLVVAGATGAIAILNYASDNLVDLGLNATQISIVSPIIAAAGLWVHRFLRN